MNLLDLWPLAVDAMRVLERRYLPALDAVAAKLPQGSVGVLLPAATFAPDPISPARLRVRGPYTSPRAYVRPLMATADAGLLERLDDDRGDFRYALTLAGWRRVQNMLDAVYDAMAALAPLPDDKLEDLAALLHRVVLASLYAAEPAGKWSISHSRRLDPPDRAHPIIRIDQYLTDLNAFRDDAHLAAWKPYGVAGHGWEAFTLLWRGEADDPAGLHERLLRRGYAADEYATALADLTRRGWLLLDEGRYRLTDKGRALRQDAEDETDRLFFTPWACLSQPEMDALAGLLRAFSDALDAA